MSTRDETGQQKTYCTYCKQNVRIADAGYVRLVNGRAIIKGRCSICSLELIKASIMPKSSALKMSRKRKRKANKIGVFPLFDF
jgi:hypothetical protein